MNRLVMALTAVILVLLVVAPTSAVAAEDPCAVPIYLFSYTGAAVANSGSAYTPAVATGAIGCAASGAGVKADTRLIVPGSTFVNSRLIAPIGPRPSGSIQGLADWSGNLILRELVPGEFYWESPIVAISPTAMGTAVVTINGYGTTTYRTTGTV